MFRPGLDIVDGLPGGERRADRARPPAQGIAGIDGAREQPLLGALHLVNGDAGAEELGDLGVHRRLEPVHADTGGGLAIKRKGAEIVGVAVIGGAGGDRDLLLDHQRPVEPGGGAAGQDIVQHLQRVGMAFLAAGKARRQVITAPARLAHLGTAQLDPPRRPMRRLLEPHPHRDLTRRDGTVIFLGQGLQLLGRDIAGDDQDGVVRRIVPAVEGQGVLGGQAFQLMLPADHRYAVGMVEIERRAHLLVEQRRRIVVGARPALLDNDVALGQDIGVGKHEIDHAVGLELHHQL